MNYEIDNLDRQILDILQKDARRPFQLIAKDLIVSGGTVHIRVNKLKEAGVITGSKIRINPEKLGYDVVAFVGINLQNARDYKVVIKELIKMPEILEAHYTTGKYNIFVKILAKSTRGLHHFLIERLQEIPQVRSTETFISLQMPIHRDVPIEMVLETLSGGNDRSKQGA